MGNVLYGLSSWFGTIWFFGVIVFIQIALAGNGQFTDLLRRELSRPVSAIALSVTLSLFTYC